MADPTSEIDQDCSKICKGCSSEWCFHSHLLPFPPPSLLFCLCPYLKLQHVLFESWNHLELRADLQGPHCASQSYPQVSSKL